MKNILMVGPIPNTGTRVENQIGGAFRSFEVLLTYLENADITYIPVGTKRFNGPLKPILNLLYVYVRCLFNILSVNTVFVNVSHRGVLLIVPPLYIISRLFRRKIIVRAFGGNLSGNHKYGSVISKFIIERFFLKADLVCLQTKKLLDYFDGYSNKLYWLPTSRALRKQQSGYSSYNKNIIFLGQLFSEKGIDLLLQFHSKHHQEFNINLYGPIVESKYEYLRSKPYYKGTLDPHKVCEVISEHDLLILPTHYPNEGYPGVIIEANSVAVPTVASDWLSIPEIVLDGKTGLLFEPQNYESMESKILSIEPSTHKEMSNNALRWSRNFSTEVVCAKLFDRINRLQD